MIHNPGSSTTSGLAVDPSLGPALQSANIHTHDVIINQRTLTISGLCVGLGIAATLIAQALVKLIAFFTHLAFYGDFSTTPISPAGHHWGAWVIAVPCIGGLIVGWMARYGSAAIRGHGIPEAMEQILFNDSKIPARITFLKPVSSAISIGSGGPFGAEGPIIATGGALGSVVGQLLHTSASERKILLSAGAAAGMTAIFGSPISALILAIELLLFEFRPRSFIPVAVAAITAICCRVWLVGSEAPFAMPDLAQPSGAALLIYVAEGACIGVASVAVTRLVYWIEDQFEKLHSIHWMWWPALGGLVVGVVGYFYPLTLGVGYENITRILSGDFAGNAMLIFCLMKLISWSIALGSGTSGGTLAPLFTLGGGLGSALGAFAVFLLPQAGVDVRIAALVGMAGIFAGASRALLASIIFAFETTRQPLGLVPLLGGCTASFMVSSLLMKHTIMTEKIARRGRKVPTDYMADPLHQSRVIDYATKKVTVFSSTTKVGEITSLVNSGDPAYQHQNFPVIGSNREILGWLSLRQLIEASSLPDGRSVSVGNLPLHRAIQIGPQETLRQAADLMAQEKVGRLILITPEGDLTGILTRKDLLSIYARLSVESHHREVTFSMKRLK